MRFKPTSNPVTDTVEDSVSNPDVTELSDITTQPGNIIPSDETVSSDSTIIPVNEVISDGTNDGDLPNLVKPSSVTRTLQRTNSMSLVTTDGGVVIDIEPEYEEYTDDSDEDLEELAKNVSRGELERLLERSDQHRKDSKSKSTRYKWLDRIFTGIVMAISAVMIFFGSTDTNPIIATCAAFLMLIKGIHAYIRPERKSAFLEYESIELVAVIDDIKAALRLPKKADLTELKDIIKEQVKTWEKKVFARKNDLEDRA